MRRPLVILFSLALVCFAAACGLDEHYTGMGEKALPGEPLGPATTDATITCPSLTCNCVGGGDATTNTGTLDVDSLAGFAWRMETIVLKEPALSLINDFFFTPKLADGTLNILVWGESDDRTAGTLGLRAGPSDKSGSGYKPIGEGSAIACDLDGATFTTTTAGVLAFPSDMFTPPELPLTGVRLSGKFTSSGDAIEGGQLVGSLTVVDAQATQIIGQDLATMLKGMAEVGEPNQDLDGDGTMDAWKFVCDFTAKKATLVP